MINELATDSLQTPTNLARNNGEQPRIQRSRMAHGEANGQSAKRAIRGDSAGLGRAYAEIYKRTSESWGAEMHHELKIHPPYFEAVIAGLKNFEIRKDDRGFQAGDTVTLREYDPEYKGYYRGEDQMYTGRKYKAVIGYVTAYEQQPGYVVFSLVKKC